MAPQKKGVKVFFCPKLDIVSCKNLYNSNTFLTPSNLEVLYFLKILEFERLILCNFAIYLLHDVRENGKLYPVKPL